MLKAAIDYHGKSVAFIQLIAAMDREGEIAREIRGKRTYRIALGTTGDVAPPALRQAPAEGSTTPTQPVEIDYYRLARAMAREFSAQTAQNAAAGGGHVGGLRAERDEYALLLEMARLRLGALLGDRVDDHAALLRRLTSLSE